VGTASAYAPERHQKQGKQDTCHPGTWGRPTVLVNSLEKGPFDYALDLKKKPQATYETVRQGLHERYGMKKEEAAWKLMRLDQANQRVQEYFDHMMRLARIAGVEAAPQHFIPGLSDSNTSKQALLKKLNSGKELKLEEVLRDARSGEVRNQAQKPPALLRPSGVAVHNVAEDRSGDDAVAAVAARNDAGRRWQPRRGRRGQQGARADLQCYRCDAMGHTHWDCPTRKPADGAKTDNKASDQSGKGAGKQ
jgi:hypothetical protein